MSIPTTSAQWGRWVTRMGVARDMAMVFCWVFLAYGWAVGNHDVSRIPVIAATVAIAAAAATWVCEWLAYRAFMAEARRTVGIQGGE